MQILMQNVNDMFCFQGKKKTIKIALKQQQLLFLSQEKCIQKVLDTFHMADAKAFTVSLQWHVKLTRADYPNDDDAAIYMRAFHQASPCGSFVYSMVSTRADIIHWVGVMGQLMTNPGKAHWDAVQSIIRYLKGAKVKCLCYEKFHCNCWDYAAQTWLVMWIRVNPVVPTFIQWQMVSMPMQWVWSAQQDPCPWLW